MNVERKMTITLFKSPSADICGLVFLVLLFAKVFGYSNLSWWIVTCPLWGPFAICFSLFTAFYALVVAFATILVVVLGIGMILEFVWYGLKKIWGNIS